MISLGNWLHLTVFWVIKNLKREELLLAITGKKNFFNLHSAAFVTVFARNLVRAYKFPIIQKTAR